MPDVATALDSAAPDPSRKVEPRFYDGAMGVGEPGALTVSSGETNQEYRPRIQRRPTFAAAGEAPRVIAVLSPALVACKYRLPAFDAPCLTQPSKPWQVVARVEVGADGSTESVMVEMGCEDPVINATIARCLYRAKADEPDGRCSGRVTVSGKGG